MNITKMLGLAALLFAGACSPKFLISDYFIPQTTKVARAQQALAGSIGSGDDAVDVTNYYLQVCDLNDGQATNCKTTLVLGNVLAVDFWARN